MRSRLTSLEMPQSTWGTRRLNWARGPEPLLVVKDSRSVQKELSQPCLGDPTSWVPVILASTPQAGLLRDRVQAGWMLDALLPLLPMLPILPMLPMLPIPRARLGGLPAFFRKDDYICKAPGSALGWRALCKCKIMLFIEPGFIQNGIKLVFLKPLQSKTNWNLSTSL